MALTRCPECRKKISESAQFCPHCGFSFKEEDMISSDNPSSKYV